MVFPPLLPIVLESPGPGELVSSRIQGSPILFTGVSIGGAAGSRIVGGTGTIDSRLGGSEGRTICIEDTDTRLPVVAGIGVFPPPLPLPSEGLRTVMAAQRSRGVRTVGILPPGGVGGVRWRTGIVSKRRAAILAACVTSEAL